MIFYDKGARIRFSHNLAAPIFQFSISQYLNFPHSKSTTVIPAPPNCTCSSRASLTEGTVRRYWRMSWRRYLTAATPSSPRSKIVRQEVSAAAAKQTAPRREYLWKKGCMTLVLQLLANLRSRCRQGRCGYQNALREDIRKAFRHRKSLLFSIPLLIICWSRLLLPCLHQYYNHIRFA